MTRRSACNSLEAHLGYWLRYVSNHVSLAFKRKVEAQGVTVAEWVVVRVLFDANEINPSEIATILGMTRGAISKLVERLARKHLVFVKVEKEDRRYQSVGLTTAGRRLVPILASLADQNDAEFFDHLTQKEQSDLVALLKDVVSRKGLKNMPLE